MQDMKFEIKSEQHSKEIQEELFKLGFTWASDSFTETRLKHLTKPYLFATAYDKTITYGMDQKRFCKSAEIETTLEELKRMNSKKKPHVHAELIKAWADGEQIEYFDRSINKWFIATSPQWEIHKEYRIKSEQTDAEKYGIEVGDIWNIPLFKRFQTVQNVENDRCYTGGKVITTIGEAKISYGMFIEDKYELVFRKGVVNLL